ncbi:MAG: thiamine pyrophosphate-binding protein [Roseburia hominis]
MCNGGGGAYARYSGKMAAVCVTCGPGATNTPTGVMGAWQDSLPMIVISGQVRYAVSVPQSGLKLRYRGTQEYEIIPTVKNMTKYAVMLTDPLAVKEKWSRQFRSHWRKKSDRCGWMFHRIYKTLW